MLEVLFYTMLYQVYRSQRYTATDFSKSTCQILVVQKNFKTSNISNLETLQVHLEHKSSHTGLYSTFLNLRITACIPI